MQPASPSQQNPGNKNNLDHGDICTLASTCPPDLYIPFHDVPQRAAGGTYENNTIQVKFQGTRYMVSRYKTHVFNNDSKCSVESRREQHHLVPWAMQGPDASSFMAIKLPRRGNTQRDEIRWTINLWIQPTCRTVPPRGSITRIFLSLQAVARRLPSVLNDMERTTSLWQSRILTGFEIIVSSTSRFQIIIWNKNNKNKSALCCLTHQGLCVLYLLLRLFSTCIGTSVS